MTGWLERHHYCAGLEVDLKVDVASCADLHDVATKDMEKDVHLPSTSLSALTQLQESLKRPSSLLLDIASSRDFQFTELFSAILTELGKDVPGSIVQEAELLLNEHPYVTQEKTPSKDGAVGESMDIFLCSAGTGLDRPVLALARLKMEASICFQVEEGTGEMRFAAVVLSDLNSEQSGRALARALATTFMDEEFSSVARSAPKEKPETIREALRAYLAKLTIVPTVNLNKAAAAKGPMSPKGANGKYTLEKSLVSGIQRRMSLVTPAEAFDISKADVGFQRAHSHESDNGEMPPTTYHIEVDRFTSLEEGWQMEKCLRQGLEVDFSKEEATPHLPRVSWEGLQEVKRLTVKPAVAIDVTTEGLVEQTMLCLRASNLPQEAVDEVSEALNLRLRQGVHHEDTLGAELVNPNEGDEAALVLVLHTKNVKVSTISGAFVRSKVALALGPPHPAARFIITLVGPEKGTTNLMDVGESLAGLVVDEELISKMGKAATSDEFVSAFDTRLGDIVLLPHAHITAKRNAEDEMLLSPKGTVPSPKRRNSNPAKTISSASIGVVGTRSYVNKDGQIVTNVKSDVGFDHMHNHGPADDLKSDMPVNLQCIWRGVAIAQKYALPLVVGVLIAMIWINVDEHSYHAVTHEAIIEGWNIFGHDVSVHFLVNDIFMCFFFGLAIKEVTEALLPGGSLSPIRRATNPLMATLGGVVGPVAAYVIFVVIFYEAAMFNGILCEAGDASAGDAHRRLGNETHETHHQEYRDCGLADFINGWGVPTATDISLAWMFAILVFGAGHPAINYLLLLAIADDALGMAIIAIAYPDPIHPVQPVWLCLVIAGAVVAFAMRYVGVKFWTPYVFIAGPIAWFGLILAQVHPALALVCIVPFMPATHEHVQHHDRHIQQVDMIGSFIPRAKSEILRKAAAEFLARRGAPLHAFEHHMKLIVDFGMFFFGVANAGVKVDGVGTLTIATFIALILGKTLGIVFFALLAHGLGFLLPIGLTVVDLFAMSALGGVGLTVALFVSNEAFVDTGLQSQAKMGAVFSVASALLAFSIKFFGDKIFYPATDAEDQDETEVEFFDDDEAEADEWLDVVAMNDIMDVLWTQRKYQARGTGLDVKKLARSVSRQNLNSFRTDGPLLKRSLSRLGSKELGSKENSRRPSDASKDKENVPER